jgi:hypothetical protein
MNQKLTIITINYNNLEGLKSTVESVVNQTWQEFEYIVIDAIYQSFPVIEIARMWRQLN